MKYYIEKCLHGEHLTTEEASRALDIIMSGSATDVQIAGLLVALRAKGETIDEIVGFAQTMRLKSVRISVDDSAAIDMCGTGGDGSGTFNISTVASFVAAGAGITVAKHGNRSVSSRCGSADVLAELGVKIDLSPEKAAESINSIGIGFLFAPMFHPSMKFAGKARTELGIQTIFNILGPLTNPAGVGRQLIGTFNKRTAEKLAHATHSLGSHHVCVVHSREGVDEVVLSGTTSVHEMRRENPMESYEVHAGTFRLPSHVLDGLKSSGKEENARIALQVLKGEPSCARDVVVANAAFGLYVSGKVENIIDGVAAAEESIDSGRALQKLNHLVDFSRTA
jgi:anthranilate phosphoribosyltransferase